MNPLAALETVLYIVSSILLFPVVAGLVFLCVWVVVSFGAFLREWLDRRRLSMYTVERYSQTLRKEFQDRENSPILEAAVERRLQEAELGLVKSLDKIRFIIRVAPALGLMGTLIPMGISLSALAQGDMPKMAGSMVTAFTTVVVGLALSVSAYVMSLVREKWVRADMREMEYLTECALQERKVSHEVPREEGPGDALP